MATCIGYMGGGMGSWRAEFEEGDDDAMIVSPIGRGQSVHVATCPLGQFIARGEDEYADLDPTDEANKRLVSIVFSPDAWAALRRVADALAQRKPMEVESRELYRHERDDAELLDEVNRVLALLAVPQNGGGE
jgi:hypothetical protein